MKRLVLAILVMGFSCSISQVLLVREFMTIFCGNELILGIIFVNWLLGIALGSWGLGRLADRPTRRLDWLVVIFILVSIVLPIQILFVRSMGGWLVAERGEMAGLIPTFYSTFLAMLPFCTLHGFQFTLGCKLYPRGGDADEPSIQISRVYVLESLGSVMGGLAFTYLLVHHLRVLEMSVCLSLLNLSVALLLLKAERAGPASRFSETLLTGVIILLIAVSGYATLSGGVGDLDAASYRWQWERLGLVHYQNSIYGNIAVTRSDGQLDFWVNGLPLFTTPDPDIAFVEEVVHFPMLQHPSPEKVLLIGGGVGGVLEELLKHPVRKVTYVELDPLIIELVGRYSQGASAVLDDPRVEVVHADGRLFVKGAEGFFDVAIVNLPSPSTLQLNRFYTIEFFREVHDVLEEDGILSIGLPSSLAHISEEMGARNKCVYDTIRRVFPSRLVVPGDYNIFLASPSSGEGVLTYDVEILYQRLRDRGLETSLFTEDYLQYKFSPERMEIGLAYLHRNRVEVNRDMRPVAVYYDLALWNAMFYPHARAFFTLMSHVELWWLIIPLGFSILALLMVRRRLRLVWTPIYLTIFTTGLAGMTFSIITLYAFQALCGYLYQELGVVAAAFMLGLSLGGWFMSRRVSKLRVDISTLAKTELAIIAYSLITPLAITLFSLRTPEPFILPLVRVALPLLNCIAGFLVGLEFPLVSRICLRGSDRTGRVAGTLYASDLFGACVGSLMSSIWLIPLHGVLGACLVAAALNAASLALLYISS